MAAWEDVQRIALLRPGASERVSRGLRQWLVAEKLFAWERPLRKSDLAALGPSAPRGPILGVWLEHEGLKQPLVEQQPNVFFTTPHFDGYPAILVQLDNIPVEDLESLIVEAWHARAPARLIAAAEHGQ